ncbi:helix-turn-helix domain-containing protein [Nesterenkonia pannonica]|uniref:helix-turn-helix domain-containing protein n=1 Tax=Nesterenkonia pannonica TaxID=1548602 RepID=UPI0021641D0E|nr:helix-turn-helix domain-containing protein [Nesterenkonia pannonica]
MAIASYTDSNGSNAHPGKERLAANTGIHIKNLRRHLKALEESGWIMVEEAGGNARFKGAATVYQLTTPQRGVIVIPRGVMVTLEGESLLLPIKSFIRSY